MSIIFNQKGRKMRTRVGDVKDTFTPANLEAHASEKEIATPRGTRVGRAIP